MNPCQKLFTPGWEALPRPRAPSPGGKRGKGARAALNPPLAGRSRQRWLPRRRTGPFLHTNPGAGTKVRPRSVRTGRENAPAELDHGITPVFPPPAAQNPAAGSVFSAPGSCCWCLQAGNAKRRRKGRMRGSSSWMQAEGGSELLLLPSAPLALQLCPPRLLLLLGGYTSTMGKSRAQAGAGCA